MAAISKPIVHDKALRSIGQNLDDYWINFPEKAT
jgi:hypothetical protein